MKILALIILWILSLLWGYFSWEYLHTDSINPLALAILLAWMFVFWVLFWKIHLFWNSNQDTKDNYDYNEETTNYKAEVENLQWENSTMDIKIEPVENSNNSFTDFADIQDNNFLNISNNMKKKNKQDLKIVEWIGPKIEELLNTGWIYSYSDLEQSSTDNIKSILESGWSRYTMHNPATWWKQAALANTWSLQELKNYQKNLVKWVEK